MGGNNFVSSADKLSIGLGREDGGLNSWSHSLEIGGLLNWIERRLLAIRRIDTGQLVVVLLGW